MKQENSRLFKNNILQKGKMRVENQTKTPEREDSNLCPETSTKNAVQEFHLGNKTKLRQRQNFAKSGNVILRKYVFKKN